MTVQTFAGSVFNLSSFHELIYMYCITKCVDMSIFTFSVLKEVPSLNIDINLNIIT